MVTMMIQYAMSTALHGLRLSRWKMRQLTRLDHAAIFLFIAGAFTPVCVLANDHTAGMIAVAAIWALALAGVCLKLFWLDAPRWASTIAFQVVVVVSYFIVYPFLAEIPGQGAYWLALGGKFYLAGSLFYAFRRPNILPGIFGHHELLHFFVLAGSACHYMVMVGYAT
jgi:hemolysin III